MIKVERSGIGDFARGYGQRTRGLSSQFLWTNRSKESLTLDVKQPAAQEILARMLKKTDVLVQNLAPDAAARLGLGAEVVRECFPKLILCDISGHGEGGPYGNKKTYDLLIQAEVGLSSVTGTREKPSRSGISVADIAAGMYAFCNILAALLHREKTGKGCQIDISLMESVCEWMGYPLYYSFDGEPPPERTGAFHSSVFPYGPFLAADGTEVFFGLQNEGEWVTFCREVLENSELSIDGRFCTNSLPSENRAGLSAPISQMRA